MRSSTGRMIAATALGAAAGPSLGQIMFMMKSSGFGRPPARGYGKYRGRMPDYERKIPRTPADHERVLRALDRRVNKARRQAKGFV